jgi:hypothetical protein
MVHFDINADRINPKPEDMDGIEWLQLLRPFSCIQMLFLSRKLAGPISHALKDIARARATDVLPVLDMLCIEERPVSSVHKFIVADDSLLRQAIKLKLKGKSRLVKIYNQA